MKTRFLMATAAAAIVMVACNNEETDNWAGEIRLSSGLETQQVTRSINTALQGGQIANGIKVGFFINEDVASDPTTTYTQNLSYTANGSGSFSGSTVYYPQSGNGVNIYAYAPWADGVDLNKDYEFSIQTDQSDDKNYLASDLLWGQPMKLKPDDSGDYESANPVARTKEDVNITFKHLLSKVTVTLISNVGDPDLTGAKVELLNVQPGTTFTPSTGTITKATGEKKTITVMDKGTNLSGSAVVVPQTLNQEVDGKRRFIKVTLKTGGELYSGELTDSSGYAIGAIEMTAGNEYKYEIKVNLTSLDITSSITEWVKGKPVKGFAEME